MRNQSCWKKHHDSTRQQVQWPHSWEVTLRTSRNYKQTPPPNQSFHWGPKSIWLPLPSPALVLYQLGASTRITIQILSSSCPKLISYEPSSEGTTDSEVPHLLLLPSASSLFLWYIMPFILSHLCCLGYMARLLICC